MLCITFSNKPIGSGLRTPIDYAAFQKHQAILDTLSGALSDPHSDALFDKVGEVVRNPFPHLEIVPSIALAQHHGVRDAPAGLDQS